jgi:micrococcal nuclease
LPKVALLIIAVLVVLIIYGTITLLLESENKTRPAICKGNAACFSGKVTAVTDGDTLKINGNAIRLALSSTPELHESAGINAREYVLRNCPVGSIAIVDEDDGQQEGIYGRTIAAVYCGDKLLNAAILDSKLGIISWEFCKTSEFGNDDWAKRNGCGTEEIPISSQPEKKSCEPSYPTLCIPIDSKDLDCGEIPYTNFKVLPPDPHGFDWNDDGVGCET